MSAADKHYVVTVGLTRRLVKGGGREEALARFRALTRTTDAIPEYLGYRIPLEREEVTVRRASDEEVAEFRRRRVVRDDEEQLAWDMP